MSEDRNFLRKKLKDGDENLMNLLQKYRKSQSFIKEKSVFI